MSKISAKIIADSINVETNDRLTTFEMVCPRFILAEINTHRSLSKSTASSRAVPTKKMRERVWKNPVVPIYFGANQKGMQANVELTGIRKWFAKQLWLKARFPAIAFHWLLEKIGLHKQVTNRLLEPWLYVEMIITGTEWRNFFLLRNHPDAQPEFSKLANLMQTIYENSEPDQIDVGDWHLPYVKKSEILTESIKELKIHSAARCARVSYFLFNGKDSTIEADTQLVNKLAGSNPKHMSPFEHQAYALPSRERVGNLVGWMQQRKEFENESGGDYLINIEAKQ